MPINSRLKKGIKMNEKKSTNTTTLRDENGRPFEIPEGGTLGLLAMGYKGIMLWREKRSALRLKQTQKTIQS